MTGQLRSSALRWRSLSGLLSAVARGVEASARLDAYPARRSSMGRPLSITRRARHLDRRLCALETRIDQELDRLTVERLRSDLDQKIKREGV